MKETVPLPHSAFAVFLAAMESATIEDDVQQPPLADAAVEAAPATVDAEEQVPAKVSHSQTSSSSPNSCQLGWRKLCVRGVASASDTCHTMPKAVGSHVQPMVLCGAL